MLPLPYLSEAAMKPMHNFASDNNSGVHPEILAAMQQVNSGHVIAYGDDPITQQAIARFREIFGQETQIYFVFGGTGANVLGLCTLLKPFEAVICAQSAHINVDECGAPEKFSGGKLLDIATPDGKLSVEAIHPLLQGIGDPHRVQPRVISITQPTELGTLYEPQEIQAIADYAHGHKMFLHMDGARICNAAAALDMAFTEFTKNVGVDVLSFGGTKNGMMYGEAVLFFKPELAEEFPFVRKQGMQLASKMRYISAQFITLLSNDLWLKNARHANQMASLLANAVARIPQIELIQKTQANAVFARLPIEIIPRLQEKFFFYEWTEDTGEVRWMTSFDTTEQDVQEFVTYLREVLG
jgi:threonine aldolase